MSWKEDVGKDKEPDPDKGKDSRIPTELQAAAHRITPIPIAVQDEDVTINLGHAFDDFVSEYYQRLVSSVEMGGGRFQLELVDFRKYIATLVASRVDYVRGRTYTVAPRDSILVPTLVNLALAGIGKVVIDEVGITLVPEHGVKKENQLSYLEMDTISKKLELFRHTMSFTFSRGYELDKRGAFDLMALQYIEGSKEVATLDGVYAHNKQPSAAYAPVSYFLGLKQLHTLLGARIMYADSVTLMTSLRSLAVL